MLQILDERDEARREVDALRIRLASKG